MSLLKLGVQLFRHASRIPRFNKLGVPPKERIQLCATLVIEEAIEVLEGMGARPSTIELLKLVAKDAVGSIDGTKVVMKDVADGLGDCDYVNEWTRCEFGIHGEPVAAEIQRTNMEKFGPGSSFRADGKVQKPPGWQPPDIQAVLDNQPSVSWIIFSNADQTEMGMTLASHWEQNNVDVSGKPMEILYHFSAPTYDEAKEVYEYLLDKDLL